MFIFLLACWFFRCVCLFEMRFLYGAAASGVCNRYMPDFLERAHALQTRYEPLLRLKGHLATFQNGAAEDAVCAHGGRVAGRERAEARDAEG
jgi:hypothetical protein